MEARQPEITLQALCDTLLILFSVYHWGYHPGEAYEKTGRMNALYSWERDSLEGPYDAEAI